MSTMRDITNWPIHLSVHYDTAGNSATSSLSACENVAEAAYRAERDIQYARGLGYDPEVTSAHRYCPECGGEGKVGYKSVKGKPSVFTKYKPCPNCHGKDSRVDCLSEVQAYRTGYRYGPALAERVRLELEKAERESRQFNAAYRQAESAGESDPHRWACDHMRDPEFAAIA